MALLLLAPACGPPRSVSYEPTDDGKSDALAADAAPVRDGARPDGNTVDAPLGVDAGVDVKPPADVAAPMDVATPADVAPLVDSAQPDTAPVSARIAIVVNNAASTLSGDQALKSRLEASGHTVTWVDDDAVAPATSTVDLVIISWSGDTTKVGSKYTTYPRPVMSTDPAGYDDLKLTGTLQDTDWSWTEGTMVAIVDPAHPLAAGLSGTVTVATEPKLINWGAPAAGAVKVATINGKASIFAYEKGATLVGGGAAAGRRVAWLASEPLAAKLTADGGKLFDAAVVWLLAP